MLAGRGLLLVPCCLAALGSAVQHQKPERGGDWPRRACADGSGGGDGWDPVASVAYNCTGMWCDPTFAGDPYDRCDQFPFAPDRTLDCKLRDLMLEYGSETILPAGDGAGRRSLYDALELGTRCQQPAPAGVGAPAAPYGFRPSARGVGVAGACGQAQRVFHVSPNGSDTTGTGGATSPFASLWRAREAVRLQPLHRREATCVILSGGTYELERTLRLTAEDGGASPEAPVIYTAEDGERVFISGGRAFDPSWSADPARPGVVVAPTPAGLRVNSLFAGARRQVRARHPNANPEYDTWPFGYLTANWWDPPPPPQHETKQRSAAGADGVVVNFGAGGDSAASPMRSYNEFSTGGTIMGGVNAGRYSPPVCFNENHAGDWHSDGVCGAMTMGMTVAGNGNWSHRTFTQPAKAVVHTMMGQPAWGNWMFQVDAVSQSADGLAANISFSRGGFQTAASDQGGPFDYFIENQLDLLDEPGEWFHDEEASKLYLFPNTTDGKPPKTVVVPQVRELISVEGSQRSPAANIIIDGLSFVHSTETFMEPYMVPGPGDWSIRQSGTVYLDGVENVTLHRNLFDAVGGNAVFMNSYVRWCNLSRNEVRYPGESAFAAVGRTAKFDATGGDYPQDNTIEYNHLHELGVHTKQTAGYFQSQAAHNHLKSNAIYNGPRSGVNWNDGMGGGNTMSDSLLFNLVRETTDHGPVNSWDRQPYITTRGASPGVPSAIPAPTEESFNLISTARGRGFATLDHDDGSSYYNDHHNVLLYGGMQNLAGGNNIAADNLYIEPCTMMYGPGAYTCENLDDPQKGHVFESNTCMCNVTQPPYRLLGPGNQEDNVPRSKNNSFLFGNGTEYKTIRFSCCSANCDSDDTDDTDDMDEDDDVHQAPPLLGEKLWDASSEEELARKCTPAPSSTSCDKAWHCKTCKVNALNHNDCLTCESGYVFKDPLPPPGEPDCTGGCLGLNGTFCDPNGTSTDALFTLKEWQEAPRHQEVGTTMGPMPPHTEVLARARGLLRWVAVVN